jgi:hypothetical protein
METHCKFILISCSKGIQNWKNCNSKIMPLYFFDSGLREVSGKIPVKFLKIRKME